MVVINLYQMVAYSIYIENWLCMWPVSNPYISDLGTIIYLSAVNILIH